jgi:hypothetical protein
MKKMFAFKGLLWKKNSLGKNYDSKVKKEKMKVQLISRQLDKPIEEQTFMS